MDRPYKCETPISKIGPKTNSVDIFLVFSMRLCKSFCVSATLLEMSHKFGAMISSFLKSSRCIFECCAVIDPSKTVSTVEDQSAKQT